MSVSENFSQNREPSHVAEARDTDTIARKVLMVIFGLLTLWAGAIFIWGYPALIVVKLALVPMIFTTLILITWGK